MRVLEAILVVGLILIVARLLDLLATSFSKVNGLLGALGISTDVLSVDPNSMWAILVGVATSLIIIGVVLRIGRAIKERL